MPPKSRLSKSDILEAAFQLVRKKGRAELNARSIAETLGCSTQPIFTAFENMEELKIELAAAIGQYCVQFLKERTDDADYVTSIDMAYIEFAQTEKNLFQMRYMSDSLGSNVFMEISQAFYYIVKDLSQKHDISIKAAEKYYIRSWLFAHGIASMLATNNIKFSHDEIRQLISDSGIAFLQLVKENGQWAEEIIAVAHPDFRDELIKEAEANNIWLRSNKIED